MASETKKKAISKSTLIHYAIGLGFMFGFPTLVDPIDPITPLGMWVLAIFVSMVYLWSTVDSIWPSILGLLVMSLVGYAPINQVVTEAFGSYIMLMIMLSFVYFGAIDYYGCTKYIARWFLTRKIVTGRPYIFLFVFFLCSFILSGLTDTIAPMFILWPIATGFMESFGIKREDKVWPAIIFGVYLAATLAQPMFPFKGSALAVIGTFQKATGIIIPVAPYVLYNIIMGLIMLVVFVLLLRFVFRVDVEKLKAISPDHFEKDPLPPMDLRQKTYLISILVLIIALMIPSFLPAGLVLTKFFKTIGSVGVFMILIVVLMLVHWEGEPLLDFGKVARNSFSWPVYFLVAAALYAANAVSAESTGIKPWLIQTLQPLLGDKPAWLFVGILLLFILITTNFANNAGMVIVLLPVTTAFVDQYPTVGLIPLYVSITMVAHFALLTPAASPYAGIMHARKDLISMKDILIMGTPICLIGWLLYTFVGNPLSTMLFGM